MTSAADAGDGTERHEQMSEERRRLHELLKERGRTADPASGDSASSDDANRAWNPLIPIQPLGSKPPLFIVHAIRGSVFPYHHLALAMGTDRPIYGLQSCGLDGKNPPIETNQEMAEAYVAAVRRVQPHGPYHLAGYSMGGWVAYEMAVQLRGAGEEVACLAALGTPAPVSSNRAGVDAWRWVVKYAEDYFRLIRNSAMADNLDLSKMYFGQQGAANPFGAAGAANPFGAEGAAGAADPFGAANPFGAAGARGQAGMPGANPFLAAMAQMTPGFRVSATNVAAQLRYIAEPCDLPVDVFLTTEQSALYWADPSMGWRSLCGNAVVVHNLHGNHLDIFQQPKVQELAAILTQRLEGMPTTEQ